MDRELVIARYCEDVSWAETWPAIVYNKGPALTTPLRQVPLPNVGREAHTYLHHIVASWDDLAETTLFTQGSLDHFFALLPNGRLDDFFDPRMDFVVPRAGRARGWGADGRLEHVGTWKEKIDSGRMRRAKSSFVEWFRVYLAVDVERLGSLLFCPGAMFSATKSAIHRRPRQFYEAMLECVSDHDDPEEAHYLERAWLYVFALPGTEMKQIYVPPS